MLKLRVFTAIILVIIVAGAIFTFPHLYFQLFLALVIGIGAWEWTTLAGIANKGFRLLFVGVTLAGIFLLKELSDIHLTYFLILSFIWWLLAFFFISQYPKYSSSWGNPILLLGCGLLVLIPGWLGINYLRGLPQYSSLIFLLLALVAAADIGAYFSGKAFGKRKLALQVSPNKTWEGFFGGLMMCCFIAFLSAIYYQLTVMPFTFIEWLKIFFSAIVIGSVSVIGDLLESMVKRFSGVKDSGNLLPGHGGILDRIDGITAAAPVFALILLSDLI